MRARTLAELDAEARALADTVNDAHISTAQGYRWINQGVAELWRKLVVAYPDRYLVGPVSFTTTAGTARYLLSTILDDDDPETTGDEDFMAIRRLDLIQGTRRIAVEPFGMQEPPYHNSDSRGGGRTRYRVIAQGIDGTGSAIYFDPDPGSNTYELWYIQAPQILVATGDSFDGVAGFEDWVVCFAAMRMCIRQETDPTPIMAEMQRIESSITAAAANRDVGRAPRIADVRPRGFLRR